MFVLPFDQICRQDLLSFIIFYFHPDPLLSFVEIAVLAMTNLDVFHRSDKGLKAALVSNYVVSYYQVEVSRNHLNDRVPLDGGKEPCALHWYIL